MTAAFTITGYVAYTRVRVRVAPLVAQSRILDRRWVGPVYHSELSYVGATTSEEEEVPAEADRYLRGWKGKISGKEQHVRPSSFPSSTARSLMLSFVIVTHAHPTHSSMFGSLIRIMHYEDFR
jgi:hypothetical protein